MKFSFEKYAEVLPELKIIIPEFISEVDIYPEMPQFNFDHDQFISLDEAGKLQVVLARNEGQLVGMHVSIIMPDIFYKHIITAYVAYYYLNPKYRGEGHGLSMFKFSEKGFESFSVERIFMSRKVYIDNKSLFKNLDFTLVESNYTKHIGGK